MRIKVMVVSGDPELTETLKKTDLTPYKMEVLSYAGNVQQAFDEFQDVNPRLVIIDQDVSEDLPDVVRRIHDLKAKCRILVAGDREDAGTMYALFKMRISGYLGKPLVHGELNAELIRISEDIREVSPQAIENEAQISMRSLYFWKLMFEDNETSGDMAFVNRIAGIYFKSGLFRVVLFRFDRIDGSIPDFSQPFFVDINYIQSEIKKNINRYLYEYCYDMIYDFRFNGLLTVLNYDPSYDSMIKEKLEEIRAESAKYSIIHYATTLTVCAGRAYEGFRDVRRSRDEAYYVSWARLTHGIGKVLFYSRKYSMHETYRKRLVQLVDGMKLTAQTVDVNEFKRLVEELFSLPDYVLTDYQSREMVLGFVDMFFDTNRADLSRHMKVDSEKERIRKVLNFSNTLHDYQKNLTENFEGLFEILSEELEKKNIRPLRQAVKYIKEHYREPLTAEILADVVSLNPVYFSHLFKKQTGINMTDYIMDYRMQIAKTLLFETDMKIAEVADAVGYQDQRYFSKRFRLSVGMTPSEYRKLK